MRDSTLMAKDLEVFGSFVHLPCQKLQDHPLHISFYRQDHIENLLLSIKEYGLFEPVIVYPLDNGNYEILSGHYRIRAIRRMRRREAPCVLFRGSKLDALGVYCSSLLLTRTLNPLEEASMIKGLIEKEGLTMEEIGRLLSHGKSWVSRRLKLITSLDPKIGDMICDGRLSARIAQELAKLPQGNEQTRALNLIHRCKMNKDTASKLVNWWIQADEKERLEVETSGVFPPRKETRLDYWSYVSKIMAGCLSSLSELIRFLEPQDNPKDLVQRSEVAKLNMLFEDLMRIVK